MERKLIYEPREQMVSQCEVKRRYAAVKTADAPKDRFNNYVCRSCNYIIKTVDKHHGCTPMMTDCKVCGEMAMSTFYNDNVPERDAVLEWVVPTLEECLKNRKNRGYLEHVFAGGLILKEIKI